MRVDASWLGITHWTKNNWNATFKRKFEAKLKQGRTQALKGPF
jgi:hypothetical protein